MHCEQDNQKLNITIIIGILAVWVSGSLFHFVYDWTGRNTFVGLFFPTNESTWEHMKLAFLPMNLYGIYTWYALKDRYEASAFAILLGQMWQHGQFRFCTTHIWEFLDFQKCGLILQHFCGSANRFRCGVSCVKTCRA